MRLIIVSNRLPYILEYKDNKTVFTQSGGGLVSALGNYLRNVNHLWVGWTGNSINGQEQKAVQEKCITMNCFPVFLTEEQIDNYYYGFCNQVLWPLFHHFKKYTDIRDIYWQYYKEVNQLFCDTLSKVITKTDVVWIHDYHLMLLPKLLRNKYPSLKIGFFLHIPFPSIDLITMLPDPICNDIMNGLLGSNLIGFQTKKYKELFVKFLDSYKKTSTFDITNLINVDGEKYGVYPISVDFDWFNTLSFTKKIREDFLLKEEIPGHLKIIMSVSRLDYSKGIVNCLLGFENFLQNNINWQFHTSLVLLVDPSRLGIEEYKLLKIKIDQLVEKINREFGNDKWMPVIYKFKHYSLEDVVMFYKISNVLVVSSFWDGMALTPKEYVASRNDGTGVLILSELTGSAEELSDSIIINPFDIESISSAINAALSMSEEEQVQRITNMQTILKSNDLNKWGDQFISDLRKEKKT